MILSLYLLGVLVSVVVLAVTIRRDHLSWGAAAVIWGLDLCLVWPVVVAGEAIGWLVARGRR